MVIMSVDLTNYFYDGNCAPPPRSARQAGDLPDFLKDMISSPPRSGDGIHLWLFRCSRQLHAHRSEEDIFLLLSASVEGCGRYVPEREIRDAITASKACAYQLNGPQPTTRPTPKWPTTNLAKREQTVANDGEGVEGFWRLSPTCCNLEETPASYFLNELFPGNPLVCLGASSQSFATKPLADFASLEKYCLVVPSPMSAMTGKRKSDGVESAHTLDNTGPRRYLVTEFDTGTPDDQAAIIRHLSAYAPLVMVMSSGGKSLHAWWRCWDAPDSLVDGFFRYSVSLGADPATWTRSQFVRLPQAWREDKRRFQEVHYFDHNLADPTSEAIWRVVPSQEPKEDETAAKEEENIMAGIKTTAEILSTNIADDETMLIGHKRRFLGKSGSFVIAGPSGIGKSTLTAGFLLHAAAGIPWNGITFRRPLKILVVQAENDDGDLAEMMEGAIRALQGMTMQQIKMACDNIVWRRLSTMTGEDFTKWLEKAIVATGADLAHIDPLLAYVGDDISSQKVASNFFRNLLQPVLDRTGAMTTMVHHTGKTSTDSKARENWSESDFAYLGFGSSELTNWARAVAVLVPAGKDTGKYKFLIAKRGKRAGMIDAFTKEPTTSIILAHSDKGMGWVQAAEEESGEPTPRRSGQPQKLTQSDILAQFTRDTATRKDILISTLASRFECSNKLAREKVENLIMTGAIAIHETEKRPEGGHPIVWLRLKKS